jgi:integrase
MLTDIKIKALKPGSRVMRSPDSGGLYLEVSTSGAKRSRLSYRFNGERRTLTLGEWPRTKLTHARRTREEVKTLIEGGEDPRDINGPIRASEPVIEEARVTWREMIRRYLVKRKVEGAAAATIKKLTLHAELTIRTMGEKPIEDICAKDVIQCCRFYEEQGKLNSAHAVRSLCSQVFRFAIAHGDAKTDPAHPTRDAIARPQNVGYPGVTNPKRVGDLMRALRAYQGEPPVRAGLLLSAYLFPRNRELRHMRWDQFDGQTWVVPAEQMKKKRDHLVPLPRQAVEVLEWIKPITFHTGRVLFSPTSNSGVLSENTFNMGLRRAGFKKEEHVHHGFRITFSTNMHEQGWNSDWIEMQLAHVEENKVKGAYNKALYLEGRAEMMQAYANWLDQQAVNG